MKFKVLLTGTGNAVIDAFFFQMNNYFDAYTTSFRYDDIIRHIKTIQPDIFVYCMATETKEHLNQMVAVDHYTKGQLPIVVIGNPDACEEYMLNAPDTAIMTLEKPITAYEIRDRIFNYLKNKQEVELAAENKRKEYEEAKRLKEEKKMIEESNKKHVLIIDDDMRMLRLLKGHLHDMYDVATAPSGKLAYKFLETKKTDLILLDYAMPGEDGPQVLENLRNNEATKDIPVIFLTGVTEKDKITKALFLKPQGYLLKPIDREKLLETIKSFV